MFERGVFVPPLGRIGQSLVKGLFEVLGETGHHKSFTGFSARMGGAGSLHGADEPLLYREPNMGSIAAIVRPRTAPA